MPSKAGGPESSTTGARNGGIVPGGVPAWITPELIEHTLRIWQPYYAEPLSAADAVEIVTSAARLFAVLRSGGAERK